MAVLVAHRCACRPPPPPALSILLHHPPTHSPPHVNTCRPHRHPLSLFLLPSFGMSLDPACRPRDLLSIASRHLLSSSDRHLPSRTRPLFSRRAPRSLPPGPTHGCQPVAPPPPPPWGERPCSLLCKRPPCAQYHDPCLPPAHGIDFPFIQPMAPPHYPRLNQHPQDGPPPPSACCPLLAALWPCSPRSRLCCAQYPSSSPTFTGHLYCTHVLRYTKS